MKLEEKLRISRAFQCLLSLYTEMHVLSFKNWSAWPRKFAETDKLAIRTQGALINGQIEAENKMYNIKLLTTSIILKQE